MQLEWTIKDDFPKFAKNIENVILYAQFEQALIPEQDTVNVEIKILMSTGLFEH